MAWYRIRNAGTSSLNDEVDLGNLPDDPLAAADMWWLLLIKGIALILFGSIAIVWPGITLYTLALLFTIFLLVSGIMDIILGARTIKTSDVWFLRILVGALEVGLGVYIVHQGKALILATFILLLGVGFILQGIMEVVVSIRTPSDAGGRLWMFIVGLLSLVAGIVILRQPIAGGMAFTWVLGIYGLVAGSFIAASAFGLRHIGKNLRAA